MARLLKNIFVKERQMFKRESLQTAKLAEHAASANLNPRQRSYLEKLWRELLAISGPVIRQGKRAMLGKQLANNYDLALIRRIKAKQEEIKEFLRTREIKEKNESELKRLADQQLDLLGERLDDLVANKVIEKKQVEAILVQLEGSKERAIQKVLELDIPENHLPLMPVVGVLHPAKLIKAVRNGIKQGEITLSMQIASVREQLSAMMTSGNYWAIDVEDGMRYVGVSAEIAANGIRLGNRMNLTILESMALAMQTDVLTRHAILANGSRIREFRQERVLSLYQMKERPTLGTMDIHINYVDAASPSCALMVD